MTADTMLDERGRAVETITATGAKNAFGKVLDTALARGVVAITKREKVRAVVLSIEAYDALRRSSDGLLAGLDAEFDALVATMRTPQARAAGDALFAASPTALGRVAARHQRCGERGRPGPKPARPKRAGRAARG
ncbi:MAG: type II toxin-antitoxin system Phd/YefM family antitoxin [Deltaproteobacteria bacterium]|nr:type II toxin-antitoxin system Phd/YefM family antitoxin [Deltaproteobacteria bacterium]